MNINDDKDTIVAISTPLGRGSIACIRVSGNEAYKAVDSLLPDGLSIANFPPHQIRLCWLVDEQQKRIDQSTLIRYPKPNSYTGEDVVEIFCHGGKVVPNLILERLCSVGCRLAEPGEFTKRAVYNNKLDLIQAESIAEIIDAETPASLQSFLEHLEGEFSRKLSHLRSRILHACALLELGLDFSDEDVEFVNHDQLQNELSEIDLTLTNLLSGFERGQTIKDGWKVAIIGKPNVGKSSLMNALLKHDRVIVSPKPGTTRDTIEERIQLNGHLFRIVDTAGIRKESDEIEQIGIERSQKALEQADIVIFVTDGSSRIDDADLEIVKYCQAVLNKKKSAALIHVRNKIDLLQVEATFKTLFNDSPSIPTSATKETGITELENLMISIIEPKVDEQNEKKYFINLRQKQCLEKAKAALCCAQKSLQKNLSAEFVSLDLKDVAHQLGILIGEVTTEDILGEIFSNFCIGK